jgi:hypothetical protein
LDDGRLEVRPGKEPQHSVSVLREGLKLQPQVREFLPGPDVAGAVQRHPRKSLDANGHDRGAREAGEDVLDRGPAGRLAKRRLGEAACDAENPIGGLSFFHSRASVSNGGKYTGPTTNLPVLKLMPHPYERLVCRVGLRTPATTRAVLDCLVGPRVRFRVRVAGTGELLAAVHARPLSESGDLVVRINKHLATSNQRVRTVFVDGGCSRELDPLRPVAELVRDGVRVLHVALCATPSNMVNYTYMVNYNILMYNQHGLAGRMYS